MSGRRSHPRFLIRQPWDGAIRVLRDVVVDRAADNELLALSHAPAVAGEELSLDLLGGGLSLQLNVRVVDSRPVIVSGSVRHRLRLSVMNAVDRLRGENSEGSGPVAGLTES